MKFFQILAVGFLAATTALPGDTVAEESVPAGAGTKLREVIVSHTDENNVLQLFRMKEDGSDSVQLTHSEKGCRMPATWGSCSR